MYEEIEKQIVRTISPFEYEQLEELKKTYSEEQIISIYKKYGDKPINYICKVIKSQKKNPKWLYTEIVNQNIDDQTINEFDDFNEFLEEFRNEEKNK